MRDGRIISTAQGETKILRRKLTMQLRQHGMVIIHPRITRREGRAAKFDGLP